MLTRDGNVKLVDFGYSTIKGTGSDENRCGTLYYAAPELFYPGNFDTEKVDVWALGILLFVMTTGIMPYNEGTDLEIATQICRDGILYPRDIDPVVKSLIQAMTFSKPAKRPTVGELLLDAFFDDPL
jgi:serine/threonine protein kinase